jgi:uncharacterized membrane protein (DUF106 family)
LMHDSASARGCQMVSFLAKNLIILRALECTMLGHLCPFGTVYVHLVYFIVIWYILCSLVFSVLIWYILNSFGKFCAHLEYSVLIWYVY